LSTCNDDAGGGVTICDLTSLPSLPIAGLVDARDSGVNELSASAIICSAADTELPLFAKLIANAMLSLPLL
jgi:hypothetical protein